MTLIIRGIIWYGFYLFLILLPLVTARWRSRHAQRSPFWSSWPWAPALWGLSLMSMEFALISRINAAARPFGEDSLQLFHNLMGITALGFILAHPILLGISGYAIGCWLNPFAACATVATQTAALCALFAAGADHHVGVAQETADSL